MEVFMDNIFEKYFDIQYCDIDSNNKLTDFAFFKYLQEVACLHADKLGFGYYDSSRTRLVWLLLDWKVEIFSKPRWMDRILIKTWPSKIEVASSYRDFEVYDSNNNLIGRATSKWVLFNIDTNRISKLSDEVKSVFKPVGKRVFDVEIEKLKEPDSFSNFIDYTISKRDIDTNLHVNNLNYIWFAYEAMPLSVFQNSNFSSIDVMYKKQCVLGDEISCFYTDLGNNEHVVTIKSKDLKIVHAILRFKI